MSQSYSQQDLNDLLKQLSEKEKSGELNHLKEKSPQELLQSLPPQDAAKVQNVMKDPIALKKLLRSPQAQALIQMMNKGKRGK